MRKIIFIAFAGLLIGIILNLLISDHIRVKQLEYHKNSLFDQTNLCGKKIENIINNYESDLNKIIYYYQNKLQALFSDNKDNSEILSELQKFYSKYREIFNNIAVYDNSNHYLGIYIKDNDEFVVDTFSRQKANILYDHLYIEQKGSKYLTHVPFYKDNIIMGNVVTEINLSGLLNSVFELYSSNNTLLQWVINKDAEILYLPKVTYLNISQINNIADQIKNEHEGVLIHNLQISDHKKRKLLSAYYPLSILNNDLSIVFSVFIDEIIGPFSRNYLILIFINISFLSVLLLLTYLLYFKEKNKTDDLSIKLLSQKMVLEQLPVGVMILNNKGIITNINLTAQKMLFLENDNDIVGKNFNDHFLISNKYLLKEGINLPFGDNHFLLYEKDGNEIVIYRKEIKTYIAGEELILSALIDISPFEKLRKQEIAANMAKSDFLAKMSHEIRTPMNGIIGMTETLMDSNLADDYKEQVLIIKRSSVLLMNVINDILDFSKIEAGKMMLEEIPFNLNEEVLLTIELFKSLANEKQIEIKYSIKQNVPLQLIGDPFRLRQVLSNLLSNAIKFTDKGSILISTEMIDKYNSTVILLFSVEDTGIGIPKENLNKIFGSYEQANSSTSRKYGGTGLGMVITRQLVEMMNGEIWAQSPGELSKDPEYPGSKFSFTIETHSNEKLCKKYDFSQIEQYQQISALILNKSREENDRIHSILDGFGINYNYQIFQDNKLDKIISLIEQNLTLYQIIVIKDKLNNDGFNLARKLKEKKLSDNFLIIMFSSNDKRGNYLKARNLGVDYYLIQPYESNEIYKILKDNFPGIPEKKYMDSQIYQIRPELKILVVEDNIINQSVIKAIFKHLGYEIDICANGEEAVNLSHENEYDIIFMDLLMPVMDGITATMEIRKDNTTVPIIALSASEDQNSINEALKSGMNAYLTKPVKVESIKQLLIKWFSESI